MEIFRVFALLSLLMKGTAVYFAAVALRWMFRQPECWPGAPAVTRFAVVIAARNEEAVIERLVNSLMAQEYPGSLFDVYVVPNNCTDNTANAALRAGAKILLCDDPVHCKGDALRQAFCRLKDCGYDAFVVFDADNVVDKHYLQKTNDAFQGGARVVKGRQVALNSRESWIAGCYDIYFSMFDVFFNRPRANGGLSVKLVGTGFALHHSVLEQLGGWSTQTLAEDAEFSAQCALAGIRVCWAPEALTYDEEPCSFTVSIHQRKRWCSGVLQVSRKLLPDLMRRPCSPLRWDMLCFLLTAQLQPVSALLLLCSQLCSRGAGNRSPLALLLMLTAYWLGCSGLACLLQLLDRPKVRRNRKSMLLFPLFMASWMPLQILAFFHKTTRWREIRHGQQTIRQA